MRRVFVSPEALPAPGALDAPFALPAEAAHYLQNVLRLRVGQRVECFDGAGRALLITLGEDGLAHPERERDPEERESPVAVTLFHAIPKGDRWTWALEKVTELGVARIVPLETARSVVRIPASKAEAKRARWAKICAAAARQCGRVTVPEVVSPMPFREALGLAATLADAHVIPHTAPDLRSLTDWLTATTPAASLGLWIGPEGGFTDAEISAAQEAGVRGVRMGPRVLRSETAAITAATLAQSVWGDL